MNHILDGVLLGGLYAGSALGLTLVFGVMRLVNLAHGEFLVGGGYLAVVVVTRLGVDPLLAVAIVAPLMFALAYPVQRFVLGRLLPHGPQGPLVATFGLSSVAQTIFVLGFGANPKPLGGAVVGFAEEMGAATIGPSYRDLVVFSLLVLVLVVRPQGLLGRRLG